MNKPVHLASRGARLGLVVAGIVVLAVIAAAIVNATTPVVALDPESAEGVVQAFLVATEEERYADAHALLSRTAQEDCDQSDLVLEQENWSRVVVEDVKVFDDETVVTLTATVVEEDPFDSYRYETELEFTLVEEGGRLAIDLLPYPFFCRNF